MLLVIVMPGVMHTDGVKKESQDFAIEDKILCIAPAFWNGKDEMIKERLFGLTNNQGNHGEDVKEQYFHLESSPTHSYCKYLYKYPHTAFPYDQLVRRNQLPKSQTEYEINDTGIFGNSQYFDCFIEYAKADEENILLRIKVHNRSSEKAVIHVLPQIWYRNFWKHNPRYSRPEISFLSNGLLQARSIRNGKYYIHYEKGQPLFCENETNNFRVHNAPNDVVYPKDGINDHIVHGDPSVNPDGIGSKVAIWIEDEIEGNGERTYRIYLSKKKGTNYWDKFDSIFENRIAENEQFFEEIVPSDLSETEKQIVRRSFDGLLWTKAILLLRCP